MLPMIQVELQIGIVVHPFERFDLGIDSCLPVHLGDDFEVPEKCTEIL